MSGTVKIESSDKSSFLWRAWVNFRKYSLHIALSCCIVAIIIQRSTIILLEQTRFIHVHVFDRVIKLPNRFVIDTRTSKEVLFKNAVSGILMGRDPSNDFMKYVESHAGKKGQECGFSLTHLPAKDGAPDSILLQLGNEFAYLIDLEANESANFLRQLCKQDQVVPSSP